MSLKWPIKWKNCTTIPKTSKIKRIYVRVFRKICDQERTRLKRKSEREFFQKSRGSYRRLQKWKDRILWSDFFQWLEKLIFNLTNHKKNKLNWFKQIQKKEEYLITKTDKIFIDKNLEKIV